MQHLCPFKATVTLLFQRGNETETTVSALLSSHVSIGVEKETASNICHDVRRRGFEQVDLNHDEHPKVGRGYFLCLMLDVHSVLHRCPLHSQVQAESHLESP